MASLLCVPGNEKGHQVLTLAIDRSEPHQETPVDSQPCLVHRVGGLGDYQAVAFAEPGTQDTSGTCQYDPDQVSCHKHLYRKSGEPPLNRKYPNYLIVST